MYWRDPTKRNEREGMTKKEVPSMWGEPGEQADYQKM